MLHPVCCVLLIASSVRGFILERDFTDPDFHMVPCMCASAIIRNWEAVLTRIERPYLEVFETEKGAVGCNRCRLRYVLLRSGYEVLCFFAPAYNNCDVSLNTVSDKILLH